MNIDHPPSSSCGQSRNALLQWVMTTRKHSLHLVEQLSAEDMAVQSMPDASPTKWHLAHTTWFFEAVVLARVDSDHVAYDARFGFLFNSYYESLGARHPRFARGLITRPTLPDVLAYRAHVDNALERWILGAPVDELRIGMPLIVLGIQHEQQHQELIVTDMVHLFSCNPLQPAWRPSALPTALRIATAAPAGLQWIAMEGGIAEIGHSAADGSVEGFAFDNETPRHRTWLASYEIADRLVTCGEYLEFMRDGGYERASLWLSDGWAAVQAGLWNAPAYWSLTQGAQDEGADVWRTFSPAGVRLLDVAAPVTHMSFYEAAAYAAWAGARLPTEHEWEHAFAVPGMREMLGQAWQWTRSSYDPYPGFKALPGIAEEYNGKFMVGQIVLRGSSAWTADGHSRATYRNFFPPSARWQLSGLRLARDAS